MQAKIKAWTKKGGDVLQLWESVKDVKRQEGSVTSHFDGPLPATIQVEIQKRKRKLNSPPVVVTVINGDSDEVSVEQKNPFLETNGRHHQLQRSPDDRGQREVDRLNKQLNKVILDREKRKKSMDVTEWRTRLLELAVERAERIGDVCGWDQRLCFGDEEVHEFGEGVLETYEEEGRIKEEDGNGEAKTDGGGGDMQVDGQTEEGAWWCGGKKKCDRHAG